MELNVDTNKLQESLKTFDELLKAIHDSTNTCTYNLSRLQELMNSSDQYAIEKAKGDVFTRVALRAAYLAGAQWSDEHPKNIIDMKQTICDAIYNTQSFWEVGNSIKI